MDHWFYFAKYQKHIRNISILIKISLPLAQPRRASVTKKRGILEVSTVKILSWVSRSLSWVPWQQLPADLWITKFSRFITASPRTTGGSKNSSSKVTLYYFTALFSPQYHEALTETVKNRFCSINPPITAVLHLLSALSAGRGETAAKGKDSRASLGPSSWAVCATQPRQGKVSCSLQPRFCLHGKAARAPTGKTSPVHKICELLCVQLKGSLRARNCSTRTNVLLARMFTYYFTLMQSLMTTFMLLTPHNSQHQLDWD